MQGLPPQIIAMLLDELPGRGTAVVAAVPAGIGQGEVAVRIEVTRGGQQHRVGGDGDAGDVLHGMGIAHLGLAHPQQRLLVAEIAFDVPTVDIALDNLVRTRVWVGGDEKARAAIEILSLGGHAVAQRSDHNQLQGVVLSSRPPAQASEGLDANLVLFAADLDRDRLPGDGLVGAQLLGSRSLFAINPAPALGVLRFWQEVEFGIRTDTSHQHRAGRQILEHGTVGVAAIDDHPEWPLGLRVVVHPGAQTEHLVAGRHAKRQLAGILPVALPLLFGGVLGWFGRVGRVPPCDGNHAGLALRGAGHGQLQEALRPDEIDLEAGAEGIARILGAADLAAGLANAGIVEGDHSGGVLRETIEQILAYGSKERIGLNALARVHPVVGGPVLRQATRRAEQGSHRVSAKADDLSEDMPAQAGTHGLGQRGGSLPKKLLEGSQEEGGVFFKGTGEGGASGRRRMR